MNEEQGPLRVTVFPTFEIRLDHTGEKVVWVAKCEALQMATRADTADELAEQIDRMIKAMRLPAPEPSRIVRPQ